MSAGQIAGTAAAVVGVGVAAAVGWKVFEAARAANALNTAARDIRAAGGDRSALDNLMASLRSTGVLSPGGEGAAVSQGTNEQTQIQTTGVQYAAERTMLAAGTAARLSPNLRVQGARNTLTGWATARGPALPSEAQRAGVADLPRRLVRGLDMNAYALTYIDDCWSEQNPDGASIVAVPRTTPSWQITAIVIPKGRGYSGRGEFMRLGNIPAVIQTGPTVYDIFLTSAAQDGQVAIWDPARSRFLTPKECQDVKIVVKLAEGGSGYFYKGIPIPSGDRMSGSSQVWATAQGLNKSPIFFQPFPPAIRGAQESALRTAPVERRGDGTAVR